MKEEIQSIEFEKFINKDVKPGHSIGDQVFLMDENKVRSPIKDLEFVANENLFIEVIAGKGYIIVNGTKHTVDGHCLISYLKGQRIQTKVTSKRTIIRGMALSDEFMIDLYRSAIKFNEIRSSIITNPVTELGEGQIIGIKAYVSALMDIASKGRLPNSLICAKLITLALFYGPLYDIMKNKREATTSRSPSISSQFFDLLESNFKEQHNISFYADSLNISKTYLYQCVVSTSGKSPSYWIDYYRISFAKNSLEDMDLSILQIAHSLNFAGLPQFAKFFKKQTGLSPRDYRQSLLYTD